MFSIETAPVSIPISVTKGCYIIASLPLFVSSLFHLHLQAIFIGVRWHLNAILICISLVISNSKHCFCIDLLELLCCF